MNERLIVTSTLSLIDSKPPITRSERFFDLVVCLHLLSQNRSQNANMSELWHTFVGWWKVTRKPLGHYRTERRKTERSGTSVHHCTDFWSLFVLLRSFLLSLHTLIFFLRWLLKFVLARIEELWFMPRRVAWSVFLSHERYDMTNIP